MNLSVIERMIRECDLSLDALRYLINCRGECEWLDYKEMLSLDSDKQLADFTKDIVAMKNMGGGYIIVGVTDKEWVPVGIASPLPFDTKMVKDKILKASGLTLDVYVVHHTLDVKDVQRLFALIFVRSSKKRNKRRMPSIVNKDYCKSMPYGLSRGDIYVRDGDSTIKVTSAEKLEELLDSLESQADEAAIMSSGAPSPFAVKDGLYRLLEKGYDTFVGRDQLKDTVYRKVNEDPRIWIINVHGPGGVGKSALVNWVTYKLYEDKCFESIIHLTAKETILTPDGIRPYSRTLYSLEDLLDHILRLFDENIPITLEERKIKVLEILSAWKTLLVLDNMETVSDGRIMAFVQEFPPDCMAKVLITSRHKSGGWEFAIPVNEFSIDEAEHFLEVKSKEMNIDFPLSSDIAGSVLKVSGGLPLAMQWIIGQYKLDKNIEKILSLVFSEESPVLEFSFRNIWERLSPNSKAILAVLSIFDSPPTLQQLSIATEWAFEKIESSLYELGDVTLVTKNTQATDGNVVYSALPITLQFAQHQFHTMGDFEVRCRQRYQKFDEQIRLQASEVSKFSSTYERYGLETDNEKKAAILCTRAQSEMFSGNAENADATMKKARELAPHSPYVYAMSASYELARNRVGLALEYAKKACKIVNKKTGELCYMVLARILYVQRDRTGRVDALKQALSYSPDDVVIRHQYGVALSRAGLYAKAIEEFSAIIEKEKTHFPARETMLMALKTRVINLRKLGMDKEADEDITFANEVIANNPHLEGQAYHIAELEH